MTTPRLCAGDDPLCTGLAPCRPCQEAFAHEVLHPAFAADPRTGQLLPMMLTGADGRQIPVPPFTREQVLAFLAQLDGRWREAVERRRAASVEHPASSSESHYQPPHDQGRGVPLARVPVAQVAVPADQVEAVRARGSVDPTAVPPGAPAHPEAGDDEVVWSRQGVPIRRVPPPPAPKKKRPSRKATPAESKATTPNGDGSSVSPDLEVGSEPKQ